MTAYRALIRSAPGRADQTLADVYNHLAVSLLETAAHRSADAAPEAALDAGFADQSHMSRAFKRGYGLTPARWAGAVAAR